MLLLLKIATAGVTILLPCSVLYRDWKYHDRRTILHDRITRSLIFASALAGIATGGLIWFDASQSETLARNIDELIAGKETLIKGNKQLSRQIDQYKSQLKERDSQIATLTQQAEKAAHGITDTIDLNGFSRRNTPGGIQISTDTPEAKLFNELVRLEGAREFRTIVALCEAKVKETPSWLTPYLFLGVSYINLGNKEKGLENLKYVRDHSFGNPDFSRAAELLKQFE